MKLFQESKNPEFPPEGNKCKNNGYKRLVNVFGEETKKLDELAEGFDDESTRDSSEAIEEEFLSEEI